jgi:hypothetical protein
MIDGILKDVEEDSMQTFEMKDHSSKISLGTMKAILQRLPSVLSWWKTAQS